MGLLMAVESPLSTELKSEICWHNAMKSYILRASKNSENIATPFYTGLFSGISEGVIMDCPFVTGLKNHPFPDIMSSKPPLTLTRETMKN